MSKASILFKSPVVSVNRQPEYQDGTSTAHPVQVIIGKQSVWLEEEAAELIINYLQVIQAYFYWFKYSRKIIGEYMEQIGLFLTNTLHQTGSSIITKNHVSDLIHQLGCLDDWRHQYSDLNN